MNWILNKKAKLNVILLALLVSSFLLINAVNVDIDSKSSIGEENTTNMLSNIGLDKPTRRLETGPISISKEQFKKLNGENINKVFVDTLRGEYITYSLIELIDDTYLRYSVVDSTEFMDIVDSKGLILEEESSDVGIGAQSDGELLRRYMLRLGGALMFLLFFSKMAGYLFKYSFREIIEDSLFLTKKKSYLIFSTIVMSGILLLVNFKLRDLSLGELGAISFVLIYTMYLPSINILSKLFDGDAPSELDDNEQKALEIAKGYSGPGQLKEMSQGFDIYYEPPETTFDSLVGIDSAVKELKDMAEFYTDDDHPYKKLGINIPKCRLLVGPPGTGKTELAKATANYLGVPYIIVSGSYFVEMFVGVGASKTRELFRTARALGKYLVFIDEIDAVGKKRSGGNSLGSNEERETTLNQLLVELDGFHDTDVIVLAATNRKDVLDPALIRPGRFTKEITVGLPNRYVRKQLIEFFLEKTPLPYDINIEDLSYLTHGYSGASIESLIEETKRICADRGDDKITDRHITDAAIENIAGKYVEGPKPSYYEKVCYHEAGHALISYLIGETISAVGVIPTDKGAGGFVLSRGDESDEMKDKRRMINQIKLLLGGRTAEEIIYGEYGITMGAGNDLKKASKQMRQMVFNHGMFYENHIMVINDENDLQIMGSQAASKAHEFMDNKLKEYLNECRDLINKYRPVLEDIKDFMYKEELVMGDVINKFIGDSIKKHKLPFTCETLTYGNLQQASYKEK